MTLEQYLNSDALKRAIEDYAENAKLETAQKTITNFQTIAASAYNEGVVEMISKGKPVKKGSLEKSKELTQMLPDNFIKGEMGLQAINGLLQAVISNQEDGVLNIGYESILRAEIENYIRIIYAIGVTSGFEIADDQNYRNLYLVNKQRFIMHGAETKKDKKTKKAKE
jgi:hypothetical protein